MNPADNFANDAVKAVVIGIVEGLTEFIPVSSTGHLILVSDNLAFAPHLARTFEIFIQLGAILALILFYRAELKRWAETMRPGGEGSRVGLNLILGFLPVAVIGLLVHDRIEAWLMYPRPVAVALIVGALAIEIVERRAHDPTVKTVTGISARQALAVGFFQCLALWPGFSRSAATILGGLLVGFTVPVAVEFSFLLSIPTLGAATLYSLLKSLSDLNSDDFALLSIGFVVAFVSAIPVLSGFLRYIKTHSLRPFVIYRILLGVLVLTMKT